MRPSGGPERRTAAALEAAFRRRWTWRTRLWVTTAGTVGGAVAALLYATLRTRVSDPADVIGRHGRGERFIFAGWHEGLVLLPLVVVRTPMRLRPRVLLSWHRDAEIGARMARRFGVRAVRGSSTRGAVAALRGLVAAHRRGDDVVVVPDGPRGPRRQAKAGVVHLARMTGAPIVPVGLAARPARRIGSWDRMQLPLPFARAAVRLGEPVVVVRAEGEDSVVRVQEALEAATLAAERAVGDGGR